jgi:hypothetical protein
VTCILATTEPISEQTIKQVEKLSLSDEQSAFLIGGVSNVAKLLFQLFEKQKIIFTFFKFRSQLWFLTPLGP